MLHSCYKRRKTVVPKAEAAELASGRAARPVRSAKAEAR